MPLFAKGAVLVAIAIPVFTSQLEKSREATDIANIRSAYAEVVTSALDNSAKEWTAEVEMQQQQAGWQTDTTDKNVAGVALSSIKASGDTAVNKGLKVIVKYVPADGATEAYVTIGGDSNKVPAQAVTSTVTGGEDGGEG